ncbi:CoA ester lyase [Nitriliruptoraceae bacterium ZYF776]|nr:CoA ester lyase [Profundirhabdus halotolerans]
MPGANERALEKAKSLAADALILDLEDAVAPDAKAEARDRVCAAAASGEYGHREVTIRANGLDTTWHADDVAAIAAAGPDAIVVPKVSSAEDVHDVEAALERGGAPDHTAIWAMLETPSAVLRAEEIAGASDRLAVLVMGTNDLVKELQAEFVPGRAPIVPALAMCVLGARSAGKVILDGVFNALDDADGFEAECVQGRQLGMDGKTLIHPKQLEPCNRVWAPTEQAVADAREVIDAFEAAQAEGRGVVTVNGRMIENLHVAQAERTVAIADAIAAQDRG